MAAMLSEILVCSLLGPSRAFGEPQQELCMHVAVGAA